MTVDSKPSVGPLITGENPEANMAEVLAELQKRYPVLMKKEDIIKVICKIKIIAGTYNKTLALSECGYDLALILLFLWERTTRKHKIWGPQQKLIWEILTEEECKKALNDRTAPQEALRAILRTKSSVFVIEFQPQYQISEPKSRPAKKKQPLDPIGTEATRARIWFWPIFLQNLNATAIEAGNPQTMEKRRGLYFIFSRQATSARIVLGHAEGK